jgi:hypothetical protein
LLCASSLMIFFSRAVSSSQGFMASAALGLHPTQARSLGIRGGRSSLARSTSACGDARNTSL